MNSYTSTSADLDAAQERLRTGRNQSCLCGSGRKYKKCCLQADENLVRQAALASQSQSKPAGPAPEIAANPVDDEVVPPRKLEALSESDRRLDELWKWFGSLNPPSAAQLDELLEGLLALPPDSTDEWSEVLRKFSENGHPDLPAVFRRIAANVPHTHGAGMSYFYWAAAEIFTHGDFATLLPEVVAGYKKLGAEEYDADALAHIEDILLANRFELEALELAEHFLPIVRVDDRLMGDATVDKCNLIFQLRAGIALRGTQEDAVSQQAVAQALRRNLDEDIEDEAVDRAAQVACETSDPEWTRDQFNLVTGDIRESEEAWQDCVRLYDSLLRVSRDAWRIDGLPPGWAFVGLSRLLESVYRAQSRNKPKRKNDKKSRSESQAGNLLDSLSPTGMEERIARACPGLLGINLARAQMLVDAHEVLLDFAERKQLTEAPAATATRAELVRQSGVLRKQLDDDALVTQ